MCMKKTLLTILVLILSIGAICGGGWYNSLHINPTDYKVEYLDCSSALIPDNFKDVRILYFTDLCYGTYVSEEHLNILKDKIDHLDFDIVLFGGDMIHKDYTPVSSDVSILTSFFNDINAPLGKFAVIGDYDLESESREILVKKILSDSNFEILNGARKLYNGVSGYISLYGYSYNDDFIDNIDTELYSIVFTHSPELYKSLPTTVNIILAGHSHENQVNIPFKETTYSLGYNQNMYISGGVGLSEGPYRLFNDPQLVILKFDDEMKTGQ